MSGLFYRRDMRFRENYLEENVKKEIPGPGNYISPYTHVGKSNKKKIDENYMDIRTCRILIERSRLDKISRNQPKKQKLIV